MERKHKEITKGFVEPMPRKQFLRLMKEFKETGGRYIANEQSEAYLDIRGAEAITLNSTTIIFRRRPSRAAVFEELFHVMQFREGKIDYTMRNKYECEIEAKEYLINNAETLELSQLEIKQTRESLDMYRIKLDELKGEEYDGM